MFTPTHRHPCYFSYWYSNYRRLKKIAFHINRIWNKFETVRYVAVFKVIRLSIKRSPMTDKFQWSWKSNGSSRKWGALPILFVEWLNNIIWISLKDIVRFFASSNKDDEISQTASVHFWKVVMLIHCMNTAAQVLEINENDRLCISSVPEALSLIQVLLTL